MQDSSTLTPKQKLINDIVAKLPTEEQLQDRYRKIAEAMGASIGNSNNAIHFALDRLEAFEVSTFLTDFRAGEATAFPDYVSFATDGTERAIMANAHHAINFALDKLEGFEIAEFLTDFRKGDLRSYGDFTEYADKQNN